MICFFFRLGARDFACVVLCSDEEFQSFRVVEAIFKERKHRRTKMSPIMGRYFKGTWFPRARIRRIGLVGLDCGFRGLLTSVDIVADDFEKHSQWCHVHHEPKPDRKCMLRYSDYISLTKLWRNKEMKEHESKGRALFDSLGYFFWVLTDLPQMVARSTRGYKSGDPLTQIVTQGGPFHCMSKFWDLAKKTILYDWHKWDLKWLNNLTLVRTSDYTTWAHSIPRREGETIGYIGVLGSLYQYMAHNGHRIKIVNLGMDSLFLNGQYYTMYCKKSAEDVTEVCA